ncbi:FKBP-type peptidyl-prolyl cis-trans isomerase FkpA/FKBP-type peptidyl-prolyl cis-trans isomerase FklB [Singulisphaera sp. GP187]|uniref:FKBP-type peptidyl-prolyl cis-trans isomerase n=1 Tax=Singulisphaera sp. GP187 TaxID=1882752 RepID=UPI000928C82C|nr:FKBP-type peptidyl-prolyl cis-trans isomerase [Singulisphaera sp. GP187]SIO66024.1 FKBP-type peptidyl-prolyl cis-trans isomerase FkpA/FKBP-type peptidyl-prolyl cis-trans isomerase FklB [Singulisphaera sp. GP187]
MKGFIIATAGLALIAVTALGQAEKAAPAGGGTAGGKDLKQKASYGIGVGIGKSFKSQSVDIDTDALAKGIKDSMEGKPALTEEQIREVLIAFQEEMLGKVKKESEAFLAKNATQKGVQVTKSGLQYQILKEGTGKSPKPTDSVSVNYVGKLINGTEFDSSVKAGMPVSFQVDQVIKGWTEALQLMKKGSKFRLFIPSELAYGARPPGSGTIRPNDALIFDVELVDINAPAAGAPK